MVDRKGKWKNMFMKQIVIKLSLQGKNIKNVLFRKYLNLIYILFSGINVRLNTQVAR